MKKIFIPVFIIAFTMAAYADSIYFSPSFWYTRGDYSDNNYSDSYAGYIAIGNFKHTLLLGYDNLTINNKNNKYVHRYFNAGGILGFTNLYVKLIYGYAEGAYKPKINKYKFTDINNLYSFDAFYTDYTLYTGVSYSFQEQRGYVSRKVYQFMLRFEYIPHWRVLLSAKPLFTNVTDGRELFGVNGRVHYLPFDRFLIKAHGFYGERAYFYDPDLLVLFNQDETQKYLAALQLEYYFSNNFNLAAGFQHTSFGSYKINYYILGVRTNMVF